MSHCKYSRKPVTVARCDCGNKIHCIAHINHCASCGRNYNDSGQSMTQEHYEDDIIAEMSYHEE